MVQRVLAFHLNGDCISPSQKAFVSMGSVNSALSSSPTLDLQTDDTKFGRGEMHLSCLVEEGDIVVYQTGTWFVDGVEVGDGGPPEYRFAQIETIQVVWTHNCEHGVLRGLEMKQEPENSSQFVRTEMEEVEFGPEQLIARIPVTWILGSPSDNEASCRSLVPLNDIDWLDT